MQRVLDRFGLSRLNRRPDDPRELPIHVGMAYYAAAEDPYDRSVFILDSGATHHMVPDGTLLDRDRETNIESTDSRFPAHIIRDVHVANDRLLPVAGIGNITRANGVTIQNVLHVPGLPANLVSVSQLMNELTSQLEDQLGMTSLLLSSRARMSRSFRFTGLLSRLTSIFYQSAMFLEKLIR